MTAVRPSGDAADRSVVVGAVLMGFTITPRLEHVSVLLTWGKKNADSGPTRSRADASHLACLDPAEVAGADRRRRHRRGHLGLQRTAGIGVLERDAARRLHVARRR